MPNNTRNKFIVHTIKCSGPGCERSEEQPLDWFVASASAVVFICRSLRRSNSLLPAEHPVCGHECAHRLFEKFLLATVA